MSSTKSITSKLSSVNVDQKDKDEVTATLKNLAKRAERGEFVSLVYMLESTNPKTTWHFGYNGKAAQGDHFRLVGAITILRGQIIDGVNETTVECDKQTDPDKDDSE